MSQSAHAGANSQASRNFRLKPNLFTTHLLAKPNYDDNSNIIFACYDSKSWCTCPQLLSESPISLTVHVPLKFSFVNCMVVCVYIYISWHGKVEDMFVVLISFDCVCTGTVPPNSVALTYLSCHKAGGEVWKCHRDCYISLGVRLWGTELDHWRIGWIATSMLC